MSNYITIKLRRGTAAQWTATNPVLAEGEVGLETDTRKFKVGTGAAAWNSLQYWGGSGGGAADFTDLGDVPASYAGAGGKYVKVKSTADGLEFGTLTIAAGDLPSGIDAAKIANGTVSNTEFQYLNGVTAPIQNALDFLSANKVPYSGASGDVNLGEYAIKAGQIDLDTSPTGTATVGTTRWNDTIGSSETTLKGGSVILKNGVDLVARVVNKVSPNTTLTKAAYQAVRVSGAQGQRLAIALAQANNDNNSADTLGLVIETIAANQEGFIMTVGQLESINTTGSLQGETWADGDILYLSPTTAGRITNVKPTAPNHIVIIGYVEYAHANNGKLYVKVMNGWELGELHDVDTTESKSTPVDADAVLLQDSADSSIWKRLTWANLKATAKTYFDSLYVAGNTAITGATKTKITYDSKGLVTAGADAGIADITGLQTALDGKVDENAAIVGATKTKITYDAKGLVTAGADATTADISDSSNKRYVTDAQLTVLGNTSGTNTGDQTITLTGDVTGSGTGSFAATIDKTAITGKTTVTAATGDLVLIADASDSNNLKKVTVDTIAALASGGGGDVTTLYNSNAQTGPVNTTTETAIFSYALPTDLAAGDTLVLSLAGVYKNGSGVSETPTIRVKLGATTMLSGSPAAIATNNTERVGGFELRLFVEATNAQRCFVVGTGVQQPIGTMAATNNATMYAVNGHGTAAEDLTSAKTLQITCQFTAANANLYMYSESVTLYKVSAA
jgi:hypothetical protein